MKQRIVDTDIHQTWADPEELLKRMPKYFRQGHFNVNPFLTGSPIGVQRHDSVPEGGGIPCSTAEMLCKGHMDPFEITYGILTGGLVSACIHPNIDYGNAVTKAYNEAMRETWLVQDPRFYGALIVNSSDPLTAAVEIRRMGDHPRIVEVLFSSATRLPLGHRSFWPIYEAAAEMNLPVSVHPGHEGVGISNGFIAGPPSTYLEWHTNLPQNYMGQIVSLVCAGVFEKFPSLKFVAIEGGIAWIPGVLWRLDKNWKALRSSVPWLKRLPSEVIIDHVRFTSQPIEEPARHDDFLALLQMIHAEKTLMFSSDYPHWDNDSPLHSFPKIPEDLKNRIFFETANELYRLEERAAWIKG